MAWKKRLLQQFKLYAITDLKTFDLKTVRDCESAYIGGVDIIQLRSKHLSDRELYDLGIRIRKIATRLRKLFIINDRLDLALAIGADGVHLGQDDLKVRVARKSCGKRKLIIGKSTHSLQQAVNAMREGADYIGFGPIFKTPTKPTYGSVGLSGISQVHKRVNVPVVCIGGIDRSNLAELIRAGASRVAVVRAIFNQNDIKRAALQLKGMLTNDK